MVENWKTKLKKWKTWKIEISNFRNLTCGAIKCKSLEARFLAGLKYITGFLTIHMVFAKMVFFWDKWEVSNIAQMFKSGGISHTHAFYFLHFNWNWRAFSSIYYHSLVHSQYIKITQHILHWLYSIPSNVERFRFLL